MSRLATASQGDRSLAAASHGAPRLLFRVALVAALTVALVFLTLPVVAIFVDVPPRRLVSSLGDAAALDALRLSLETSAIALAVIVIVGTPAAYWLATRRFRGRELLVTMIELPLVVPPAAAGIGLLAALGPHGILGSWLDGLGVSVVLETSGVVVALIFVASPFYLRQAQAGFAAVDPTLIAAARTLGASEARAFARVAVPVAGGALAAGASLAWARAVGEFGATLVFAGSLRGVTQTAPLAILDRFSTDLPGALALAAVLVATSAALLLSIKLATRGRGHADAEL
ncbi:MAG TPA: ABC transporter permease [Solirubrobacteraceae bacterium]|nr:ABC transporter permease [Solirubrobacteraceae bacterium]